MTHLTEDNFKRLVSALKAAFPDPKLIPNNEAFNTWFFMLKDISYEDLSRAVKLYIQTESKIPTIADLRQKVKDLEPMGMTELEAWGLVSRALKNSAYHYESEFEDLPPEIQKAVGRAENLKEWALMDSETVGSVIQSQFLRSYRVVAKRTDDATKISRDLAEILKLPVSERKTVQLPPPPKKTEPTMSEDTQRKLTQLYEKLGGGRWN